MVNFSDLSVTWLRPRNFRKHYADEQTCVSNLNAVSFTTVVDIIEGKLSTGCVIQPRSFSEIITTDVGAIY